MSNGFFKMNCKFSEAMKKDLIGMSEKEAINFLTLNGLKVRISRRNGMSFILTRDHKIDRVNLIIEDDKVSDAWAG